MPVLYKTIQSTMKTKDGDKLYHPRTVYVGSVNTEKIAQEIAEYSSLSKGDVKNSIDNLVTVMTRHLQSSEVVTGVKCVLYKPETTNSGNSGGGNSGGGDGGIEDDPLG